MAGEYKPPFWNCVISCESSDEIENRIKTSLDLAGIHQEPPALKDRGHKQEIDPKAFSV